MRRVLGLRRLDASTSRARGTRGSTCAWPRSASEPGDGRRVPALSSPSETASSAACAASSSDCAVRQPGVLGVELVPFVGAGRELVDLADLPGEALALALQSNPAARAPSASVFCAARQRCHSCLQRPRCRRRRSRRAGRAPHRPASGFARRAGHGCRRAARPASRNCAVVAGLPLIQARLLPCAVDGAPQQQRPSLASTSKPASAQPGDERRRQVELGADVGARRAFAHHAGVAAAAERQLQRIDEDGLAGAGFAGEHAEAARTRGRARVDDDEVARVAQRRCGISAQCSVALDASAASCAASS